ncbi:hypothetical protein FIBSPDRAFT_329827 [Athelia psychrophila]|uniref:Secreted protein n=1 Tax=Athelia psychrophila TaxID=1759441 RepID=A0A167WJQ3_9AGAM|nr:hypothetical protein FIBSPDRAFT_329827 [Fibularhizoctonia sp. CBS 109695]
MAAPSHPNFYIFLCVFFRLDTLGYHLCVISRPLGVPKRRRTSLSDHPKFIRSLRFDFDSALHSIRRGHGHALGTNAHQSRAALIC